MVCAERRMEPLSAAAGTHQNLVNLWNLAPCQAGNNGTLAPAADKPGQGGTWTSFCLTHTHTHRVIIVFYYPGVYH